MPADKMIPRLCSNFISSRSKNCFEVWPSEWPGQTGHSIGCSRLDAALNERGIPTASGSGRLQATMVGGGWRGTEADREQHAKLGDSQMSFSLKRRRRVVF